MSVFLHRKRYVNSNLFSTIIVLSAWGFALALASLGFLWLGHLLDEWLGTSPKFMLAFFLLAIIGCLIELYQVALKIMKETRG